MRVSQFHRAHVISAEWHTGLSTRPLQNGRFISLTHERGYLAQPGERGLLCQLSIANRVVPLRMMGRRARGASSHFSTNYKFYAVIYDARLPRKLEDTLGLGFVDCRPFDAAEHRRSSVLKWLRDPSARLLSPLL